MAIYLKQFSTHSEYDTYINGSGAILPNVSVCKDQPTVVHYNPWVDPYNGHEYVDLGLPSGTKWATMDVGASIVTDYGNYYKYGKGSATFSVSQDTYTGTENPLATSADTAAQVMGGSWHMPTSAQCAELTANTTYEWVTNFNGSGIDGGKFTATNGKYVFFPAAGYMYSGGRDGVGVAAFLWSSTPNTSGSAWAFSCNSKKTIMNANDKSSGYTIRGVVG